MGAKTDFKELQQEMPRWLNLLAQLKKIEAAAAKVPGEFEKAARMRLKDYLLGTKPAPVFMRELEQLELAGLRTLADLDKEKALIEKGIAASSKTCSDLCARIGNACAARSPTWVKNKLAGIAKAQASVAAKINAENAIVLDPAEKAFERRLKLLLAQAQAGDAKATKEHSEAMTKQFPGSKEYAGIAQKIKKPEASPDYVKLGAKKQKLQKFMAALMPKYKRIADGAAAYSKMLSNTG